MFRHPKVTSVRNALLQPFTVTVWVCVLGTWLLVLFTLKITTSLESTYDSDDSTVDSSWSATMLATVGAVSEQGSLANTAVNGKVSPVLNKAPRQENVKRECRYSSTHS